MTEKEFVVMEDIELNEESFDFDALEQSLENELSSQMADLEILEEDRNMIGNPSSLGESVMNVVWEQFINQIGVEVGKDFIKKNRGLTLDLRESSHIQTGENFKAAIELDGKIGAIDNKIKAGNGTFIDKVEKTKLQIKRSGKVATHNRDIDFNKRYESYSSNFQYDNEGNVITKFDRIDNENKAVLKDGYRKPFDDERKKQGKVGSASMHMDETVSIGELCRDADVNAYMDKEEIIEFDISDSNLNPMSAPANESKNDHNAENWLNSERNGQKPSERFDIDEEQIRAKNKEAREELERRKEKGKQEAIETGKESIKAEAKLMGKEMLKAILLSLLFDLIKNIIHKLIDWFRSSKKKINTFVESVKEAINVFVKNLWHNLKQHLKNASKNVIKAITTAIIGPVVNTILKVWVLFKQGYKSLREAIDYVRNSKNKPFSILMLEVGKIIIAGLTAGGAILLGEAITKGLMSIPGFAFEIPLLGNLASILGIFFGALVSGIIGAIALNLIDKAVAKKQMTLNTQQQIEKKNEIIQTQDKLAIATVSETLNTRIKMGSNISNRHEKASESVNDFINNIKNNMAEAKEMQNENKNKIDSIKNMLNKL